MTPAALHKSTHIPIDASWFMPNHPDRRDGQREFNNLRIPGARFFDLDAVSDSTSPFPHMFPTGPQFATQMSRLGIRRADDVCVYDSVGLFSAARAYVTFKLLRHAGDVAILAGGLPAYLAAGLPVDRNCPETETGIKGGTVEYGAVPEFDGVDDDDVVVGFDEVVRIARGERGHETVQVLDARPGPRFSGRADEPRAGLSSGHMPRSTSLPFATVLDEAGEILAPETLRRVLTERGVRLEDPIVVSCGSGVTACILSVALESIGVPARIYDESWTGYADDSRAGKLPGMIIKD